MRLNQSVRNGHEQAYRIKDRKVQQFQPKICFVCNKKRNQANDCWFRDKQKQGYQNNGLLVIEITNTMKKMIQGHIVRALDLKFERLPECEACIMGKLVQKPCNITENYTVKPLQLIQMDLCGPMPCQSLGGSKAQTSGETAESYIQEVLLLCRQSNPGMSEGKKVSHLIKGVAKEIYQALIGKDISTVDHLLRSAADSRHSRGCVLHRPGSTDCPM
ncbi:hypothetical protein LAZ67_10001126 [Cordylochernes scorpioides]|uniref:Uncharacterized protein n=1 Tax=Cordylochernes scorpioides TaxID=51811 RepID=A0ABY6KVL0_9ARAC|nr:hypothetical protein LAZ67_10001126 [Cordylochernes scorpioides]